MEPTNINLVSYCGFYCGACSNYTKGQCEGCKGDNQKCAIGYKACQVRPCCIENGYNSCADCNKFTSVKNCKLYNPNIIRFGQFITRTNRRLGIGLIKEKGEKEFVKYMIDKNWVTIKSGSIMRGTQ